jgi:hypothetical protein
LSIPKIPKSESDAFFQHSAGHVKVFCRDLLSILRKTRPCHIPKSAALSRCPPINFTTFILLAAGYLSDALKLYVHLEIYYSHKWL